MIKKTREQLNSQVELGSNLAGTGRRGKSIPCIVWISAAFVLSFCMIFSAVILDGIPHVTDEAVYVFQAKIFNLGRVTVSSPCAPDAFDYPHMINNGRWYGQYPPGYPLLLMPWVALGIPWLLNPLLAGLSIFVFYYLGAEIYGRRIGILTSLLAAMSIWLLIRSATMFSHPSCMFFMSIFMLAFFRWLRLNSMSNACLLSFSLGMAFLIRPSTVIFMGLPFVATIIRIFFGEMRKRRADAIAMILVGFSFLALFGIYNQQTNGHPLTLGYSALYGSEAVYGFGKVGFTETPHSLYLGQINAFRNLASLNKCLFGWPFTSAWLLIPVVIAWWKQRRVPTADLLLISSFGLLIVGYSGYAAFTPYIDPRLLYEGIPIMLLLSAKGLNMILAWIEQPCVLRTLLKRAIGAFLAILFISHAIFFSFPKIVNPDGYDRRRQLDEDYRGVTNKLSRTVRDLGLDNALVLVHMVYTLAGSTGDNRWGSGFIHNDPLLRGNVIFANAKPETFQSLRACFPARSILLYTGTLEKGLLMPLSIGSKDVGIGAPLGGLPHSRNRLDLFSEPSELFKVYSDDFRLFLRGMLEQVDLIRLDVSSLAILGRQMKISRRWQEAAHYFEAGLQLEIGKKARQTLLYELVTCYIALGNRREAEKINSVLINADELSLIDLMPEKGF